MRAYRTVIVSRSRPSAVARVCAAPVHPYRDWVWIGVFAATSAFWVSLGFAIKSLLQ